MHWLIVAAIVLDGALVVFALFILVTEVGMNAISHWRGQLSQQEQTE